MKIDAVDLFCGAGGLSYGLQKAGLTVRAGIDLDPACTYAYSSNIKKAKFFERDIKTVEGDELTSLYRVRSMKLLAGCAPCQPFSTLRNGTDKKKSDKWPLLNEFARLVKEVSPDFVTMENVPALKGETVFSDFMETLKDAGYHAEAKVVDAAEYGVPQRRKRLVVMASRLGPISLLSPKELGCKIISVKDAIGDMPSIQSGETYRNDPLHKARSLSPLNLRRIKASKAGGTWKDWPEELVSPCHKKAAGDTYRSVYARMEWTKPAPTMTTQCYNFGSGRFGHPVQNRAISLREAAVLQSFPRDYEFVPHGVEADFSNIGRLIGNAVPVDLGYAIGASFLAHEKKFNKRSKRDGKAQL